MKALLQRWQASREARVLARRAIPDALWQDLKDQGLMRADAPV